MTHLRICGDRGLAPKGLALGIALAALPLALPALAQEDVTDRTPSVREVALTPLSDLNLAKDPIPPVLLRARQAPYANNGLSNCTAILSEVGNLDAVLGDDFDTSSPDDREITPTGVAQRVVGMLIPFRGIIREVSGANNHEFQFREAIAAGLMRRAYLKGKGEELGCAYPARPAPPELAARLKALEENPDQSAQRIARIREEAVPIASEATAIRQSATRFTSQPVVQDLD